jgi:hypothetical protein
VPVLGGLGPDQRVAAGGSRVDPVADALTRPRDEAREQERAEQVQQHLQACGAGPEREVGERRDGEGGHRRQSAAVAAVTVEGPRAHLRVGPVSTTESRRHRWRRCA